MTIKFFAKNLTPNVEIIVFKNDERLARFTAGKASETEYADAVIKDFTMSSFHPAARVDI